MGYACKSYGWARPAEDRRQACWSLRTSQAWTIPSVCGQASMRVLIQHQLHSHSQHLVVVLRSEEVWRSHYEFCLPGQDAHASLEPQWMGGGCGRGRGGKDVAVCNCTLFCFFCRIKLLILLSGCGPSFLLSLAIEKGLNYWSFQVLKINWKRYRAPGTAPSHALYCHSAPETYSMFLDNFGFPLKKFIWFIISFLMMHWTPGQ